MSSTSSTEVLVAIPKPLRCLLLLVRPYVHTTNVFKPTNALGSPWRLRFSVVDQAFGVLDYAFTISPNEQIVSVVASQLAAWQGQPYVEGIFKAATYRDFKVLKLNLVSYLGATKGARRLFMQTLDRVWATRDTDALALIMERAGQVRAWSVQDYGEYLAGVRP